MDEREQDILGGPGIDTPIERQRIEYRPRIEMPKKPGRPMEEWLASFLSEEEYEPIGEISIAPLWEQSSHVYERLTKLEERLSNQLASVTAPISSSLIERVQEAANRLGEQVQQEIPFSLYKKALYSSSPDAMLIQEVFEDYHADVNGVLEAEVYPDVVEMKQDWEDILSFMKKGLFAQFIPFDQLPDTSSLDESTIELIHQKEKEMYETYAKLQKLNALNEEVLDHLPRSEQDTEAYQQLLHMIEKDRQQIRQMERKIYTKEEIVDLLQRKTNYVDWAIQFIESALDFSPYKDQEESLLYHWISHGAGRGSILTMIQKTKAILKLTVDAQKEQTKQFRSQQKGMVHRHKKQKVHQSLIHGIYMRRDVAGDMHEFLHHFYFPKEQQSLHLLASHLVEGINRADQLYEMQSSDFYRIHTIDHEIRKEKLKKVVHKDTTRRLFQLLTSVHKHIQESGSVPRQENAMEWVRDFLSHYPLS